MDYRLHTLVDITNTGRFRNEPGYEKEKFQEQNFNTVLQTIGMRSNVNFRKKPEVKEQSTSELGFPFDDNMLVWTFEWSTDGSDIWLEDGDQLALLRKDFEFVPFITNLDEALTVSHAAFKTRGKDCNIVFELRE
jgi:hypothetical protein